MPSRPKSSSSSSSSGDKAKKKLKKLESARKLLEKSDADFRAFSLARQEKDQEALFRKQGEVLAQALGSKFAETIAAAQQQKSSKGEPVGPQQSAAVGHTTQQPQLPGFPPPQPANPPADGFSPGQLKQIKELLAGFGPQEPEESEEQEVQCVKKPRGKAHASGDSKAEVPTPLQKALLASMFGGRLTIGKDFGAESFKSQLIKCWSQRAVPDAVGNFLKEHAPGVPLPKPKEARLQLFWETLVQLS